MKRVLFFFLALAIPASAWLFSRSKNHPRYEGLQSGDIVFQDTGGEQGRAVTAATGSKFTHVGVVINQDGVLYVLEAVQPVSVAPLSEWKKRSKIFHARRLIDRKPLDIGALKKAKAWAKKQVGKDYDLRFKWDDETLYCSELVWKIYEQAAGVRLCEPKSFSDYFIEDPVVRSLIEKRYGQGESLPLNEPVVAPSDLARSALLREVPLRGKKAL